MNNIISIIEDVLSKDEKIYLCYIFGSFGSDDFNDDSDIDIAIYTDLSYNSILEYMVELEDRIGRNIDLVNIEKVYPAIQLQIMLRSEIVFINDEKKYWEWYDKFSDMYNNDIQLWKKGCILDGIDF